MGRCRWQINLCIKSVIQYLYYLCQMFFFLDGYVIFCPNLNIGILKFILLFFSFLQLGIFQDLPPFLWSTFLVVLPNFRHVCLVKFRLFFLLAEERIISRFGSFIVEFIWYYRCIVTGMSFTSWCITFVPSFSCYFSFEIVLNVTISLYYLLLSLIILSSSRYLPYSGTMVLSYQPK